MEQVMLKLRENIVVRWQVVCCALLINIMTPFVVAKPREVELGFSDPMNAGDVTITFTDTSRPVGEAGRTKSVPVSIPANTTAQGKRDLIAQALKDQGFTVEKSGKTALYLSYVDDKVEVKFKAGQTAESDVVSGGGAVKASIDFEGEFEPMDSSGMVAEFSAGVITDLGAIYAVVDANELGWQTDGVAICAALFGQLMAQADGMGVELEHQGSRIAVAFDEDAVVEGGGIQVGTTSPSAGSGGRVLFGVPELELTLDQFVAGAKTTFQVSNAGAFESVYFVYGLGEAGDFAVPSLDVVLDIARPKLIGVRSADANGVATLSTAIPQNASGLKVLLQAAEVGGISMLREEVVQ